MRLIAMPFNHEDEADRQSTDQQVSTVSRTRPTTRESYDKRSCERWSTSFRLPQIACSRDFARIELDGHHSVQASCRIYRLLTPILTKHQIDRGPIYLRWCGDSSRGEQVTYDLGICGWSQTPLGLGSHFMVTNLHVIEAFSRLQRFYLTDILLQAYDDYTCEARKPHPLRASRYTQTQSAVSWLSAKGSGSST